ncbi:MAG: TerB family tellurite resistance protein [Thiobacillus sp.]|nr:TerB family tellurite resistance protein [Thiobacillus sp.]
MFDIIQNKLRDIMERIAPSPEARPRQETVAVQQACCQLLMEAARLEEANGQQKRKLVAQVMRDQFDMPEAEVAAMIEAATRRENLPTSYFDAVKLINSRFDLARKVHFVEQLWRVAMVDGDIDMYEVHLVRKLADLLYVPHNDFILAKNRVRASVETQVG